MTIAVDLRRVVAAALIATVLIGCRAIPNMDATGSGCANRHGAGPESGGDESEGVPLDGIAGLRPADAAAAAAAQGHVVVFRLDSNACVCVPPAGYGPVVDGWWGANGQLYLDLQDVTPMGQRLPDGTGC